jgi:hypothetical protein
MAQHIWSESDIGAAIRILARHSAVGSALDEIAGAFGKHITHDSLDHALRSRGFGTAFENLGSPWRSYVPAVAPANTNGALAGLESWLVIPDSHVPFHDLTSWNLMMQVGRRLKEIGSLTKVISVGDLADCYSVSFHPKSQERRMDLKIEVKAINAALDEIDSLGVERYITLGNHEFRLARYINEKARELFGLVDLESLLGFKRRGWHVTDYRDHLKLGDMYFTHETGDAGQMAAVRSRAALGHSVAIGHCHRLNATYDTNVDGASCTAMSMGCLVDVASCDYMHKSKTRFWQQGFGVAHVEPSGRVHLVPVPIRDGRCVVNGELFVRRTA